MNNGSVNARNEETTLGEPMVPEPEEPEAGWRGVAAAEAVDSVEDESPCTVTDTDPDAESDELFLTLSEEEEVEDMTTEPCDSVPHGAKSESGTKVIKAADLVSM